MSKTLSPRIVILTSNHQRHHYFVNQIAAHYDVIGVFQEKKRPMPQLEAASAPASDRMRQHLDGRDTAEQRYFSAYELSNDLFCHSLEAGEINTPASFNHIQALTPDVILLFGASIVKPPLLTEYEGRMINMHLGLSPYYRGAGTNFWPLVNNQPECVGVTIHHAILKVDAGPILHQARPIIADVDDAHDIGCKTIMAGTEGMIAILRDFSRGRLVGKPQIGGQGLLYKRQDFSEEAVRKMKENFEDGRIDSYLCHKEERDQQYPIVTHESIDHQLSLH